MSTPTQECPTVQEAEPHEAERVPLSLHPSRPITHEFYGLIHGEASGPVRTLDGVLDEMAAALSVLQGHEATPTYHGCSTCAFYENTVDLYAVFMDILIKKANQLIRGVEEP